MSAATLDPRVRDLLAEPEPGLMPNGWTRVELDENTPAAPVAYEVDGWPGDDPRGGECNPDGPIGLVALMVADLERRVAVCRAVSPHLPPEVTEAVGFKLGLVFEASIAFRNADADWGDVTSGRVELVRRLAQRISQLENAVWVAIGRLTLDAERAGKAVR